MFPAGGIVSGAPLGRDSVERGVVIVLFFPNTPQAARQSAVDAIQGSVIGGSIIANGDGFYYLRIPDDGTAASVALALTALDSMPQVEVAIPAEPNSLSSSRLDAIDGPPDFRTSERGSGTSRRPQLGAARAQTRGRIPALRDSVILGVADTAAHLYREFEGNGPPKPARQVIREQRDLDEVWSTLDDPAPRIDFSQNDVLVAAFGISGAVGPAINIDTVLIRGAERIVVVRVTDINARCLAGSAYTYPIDIVMVPHDSTRTTQFVERRATFPDCAPRQLTIHRYRRP